MLGRAGPSGPSERGAQGPSGPSERGAQGPSGPSERGAQGPSGPSERDGDVIIAGGGTAGHVLPGLAVGRALVDGGRPASSVHYVGSRSGIEARLVPEAGFDVTLLPGRGLERRLSKDTMEASWGIARAVGIAMTIMTRRRPSVVLALGGYASVPCGVAAALLRVPLVVHEQNAVPGAANRVLARFARGAAVSFPGTNLPRSILTGNPVRAEVLAVDRRRDRDPARRALGLPTDRLVLAVWGGSLGAHRINLAVAGAVEAWKDRTDLAIRHIVGRRDWPTMGPSGPSERGAQGPSGPSERGAQGPSGPSERGAQGPSGPSERGHQSGRVFYQAVEYEERMALVLAAADLVVSRAGATTVAELAAVGLPSILVPLPGAPGDHQTANARYLADNGAAILVEDAKLDAERLVGLVDEVLGDPGRLEAMSRAAAQCGRTDAAARVAGLVEEYAARGARAAPSERKRRARAAPTERGDERA